MPVPLLLPKKTQQMCKSSRRARLLSLSCLHQLTHGGLRWKGPKGPEGISERRGGVSQAVYGDRDTLPSSGPICPQIMSLSHTVSRERTSGSVVVPDVLKPSSKHMHGTARCFRLQPTRKRTPTTGWLPTKKHSANPVALVRHLHLEEQVRATNTAVPVSLEPVL